MSGAQAMPGFTGGTLSRVADHRNDAEAFAAAMGDWRARLLKLDGYDPEITEDGRLGKALTQTNHLQRQLGQRQGIARQDAQLATAPIQGLHQFTGARRRLRGQGQFALMSQEPGMLGRRLILRQLRQVGEDVVLLGDVQSTLDRRKVVNCQGQGAVHVEHPVLAVT